MVQRKQLSIFYYYYYTNKAKQMKRQICELLKQLK